MYRCGNLRGIVRLARELNRIGYPPEHIVGVEESSHHIIVANAFLQRPGVLDRTGLARRDVYLTQASIQTLLPGALRASQLIYSFDVGMGDPVNWSKELLLRCSGALRVLTNKPLFYTPTFWTDIGSVSVRMVGSSEAVTFYCKERLNSRTLARSPSTPLATSIPLTPSSLSASRVAPSPSTPLATSIPLPPSSQPASPRPIQSNNLFSHRYLSVMFLTPGTSKLRAAGQHPRGNLK